MANPAHLQKKKGQYLWFSLLGLGFQPDVEASLLGGKPNMKHVNIGPTMFDKPNKNAFYIVTHFLLDKLDANRFHETYRYCWPVSDHKTDAGFRKATQTWLREIMDETANAGSKVTASLFLSPGGPKFISLMLHLTNHVMLQEMKTFTTDGTWFPEASAQPSSTLDMAHKRFSLVRTRFLRAAVDQDRFLHEYQLRAQTLVKSMNELKADGAKYDELLRLRSSALLQDETICAEKVKKVRALWAAIKQMLSSVKENQDAVESVLSGEVDQYVLDGTERGLKLPRCLLDRIEQLPNPLNSGNVYEGGQLNLLCTMELLNHSLRLLKEERRRLSADTGSGISLQQLQEKRQQMARVLQNLQIMRQKLSKEEIPEVCSAIRKLECDWDRRWRETLKETPLVSFLSDDPALRFLSPMAPLCFEPASDDTYRSGIFSQYPAKLLDETSAGNDPTEGIDTSFNITSCPLTAEPSEAPVAPSKASRANTSMDWLFDTPPSPPQKAKPITPLEVSMRKTTQEKLFIPPKTKSQILDLECDNLADQFADAVITTSPSEARDKRADLEELLGTLQMDPFSARKQIPRTPESLILDVRSSWRKAVEDETRRNPAELDSLSGQLSPLEPPPSRNPRPVSCTTTADDGVRQALTESFNTEAPDSPSGTGSSAVQFSLEHETLPELPSFDSFSLEDEAVDMESGGEEEVLVPSLRMKSKRSPLTAERSCDGPLVGSSRQPATDLFDFSTDLDEKWLMEPAAAAAAENPSKTFSLDLDSLDAPSPSKQQDYSLPKLITFSPIDDMKR